MVQLARRAPLDRELLARLALLVLVVHLVFTDRISAMLTKLLLWLIPPTQ
jgi:hypothetical protein